MPDPVNTGTHRLSLACACGSTLKMSYADGNESQAEPYVELWNAQHPDGWEHEPVTIQEAAQVRYGSRKRKRAKA